MATRAFSRLKLAQRRPVRAVRSRCQWALVTQALAAQCRSNLVQGQSVELNLPPGRVSVRLGLLDAAPCRAGMGVQEPQTITLQAGMVSRYELGMNDHGLYLIPSVPLP